MTMEETREPQQPATAPMVYPAQPVYPAPQPYYAPAPKVGRFARFRRLMRLLLRRLLYGSVVVGRVIRPYAGFVVAIIALLGVIGWMSVLLWWPRGQAKDVRVESLAPAPAVEHFIQGQQNYDADMMWDALS